MNRIVMTAAFLVGVFVVSQLVPSPRVDAQTVPPASALAPAWPPSAVNMVTISETGVVLNPSSSHDFMTVPSNRWFVLTDVGVQGGYRSVLRLEERIGGSPTTKVPEPSFDASAFGTNVRDFLLHLSTSYGLGIAFQPGSTVTLTNTSNNYGYQGSVTLIGYYTK